MASSRSAKDGGERARIELEPAERHRLGLRVRELRRLRGLTTREFGKRVGVSSSMISQIETGRTSPSIGSLRRLAKGLGVPVAEFLLDPGDGVTGSGSGDERAIVVRRDERRSIHLPESHLVLELLTPDLQRKIEFLWLELEPDHPRVESMSHPGEECAVVLAGVAHFVINDEEYVLNVGDCISFDSGQPHRIENRGDERMVEISAITPPSY